MLTAGVDFPIVNPYEQAIDAYSRVSGQKRQNEAMRLQNEMARRDLAAYEERLAAELAMQDAQRQATMGQARASQAQAQSMETLLPLEQQQAALAAALQQQELERLDYLYGQGLYTPEAQKIGGLMALAGTGPMPGQAHGPMDNSIPEMEYSPPAGVYEPDTELFPAGISNNQINDLIAYELMTPDQRKAAEQGMGREATIMQDQLGELRQESIETLKETPRMLKSIQEARKSFNNLPRYTKGAVGGRLADTLGSVRPKTREDIDIFNKNMAQLEAYIVKGIQEGRINEADRLVVRDMIGSGLGYNPNAWNKVANFVESDIIRNAEKAEFVDAATKQGFSPLQIEQMFTEYQRELPAYSSSTGEIDSSNMGMWPEFFGMKGRSQFKKKRDESKEDPLGIR